MQNDRLNCWSCGHTSWSCCCGIIPQRINSISTCKLLAKNMKISSCLILFSAQDKRDVHGETESREIT